MDHNGRDRGRMKRRGVDGNIQKKRIHLRLSSDRAIKLVVLYNPMKLNLKILITAVPLYVATLIRGHPSY